MAEGTVQIPPDSTGTVLRTITNAGVAGGAHQEVVTVADSAGNLVAPLTDTQLRASAVPVSGTLAVTESGTWTVVLDATSLAALETINAAQSGTWTVDLSSGSLAALETIELGATTLAALETISITGTVAVTESGTWTVELGSTTLAALESITVVDGGGSITVDGTFWQATQPVSGPLTDAQLRATAVPVSGTVTVDSELVAYTEDAAAAADPVGSVALHRRKDTLSASEVSADGDWIAPQATAKGELYVKHVDSVPVTDAGGTLSVDDGAGSLTVDGTVAVSGSVAVTGPLTDAQLRASAVPVDTELVAYTEDVAAAADPVGSAALLRRKDTLSASEVSADGDWIAPQATAKGEQYVKHVDAIPITDNGGNLSVDDGGGSLTVDGTFWQATQPVSGTFWQATQPVSGTFWQATQPVSGPLTDAQLRASAVPVDTELVAYTEDVAAAADPVGAVTLNRRKDSLSASEVSADGDWIAPQATSKGELYVKHVDSVPVTDAGGTLSVDDGAGSLTVDGTFWQATQPVSGTFWQATQPVSGPLTDAQLRASAVPVDTELVAYTEDVAAAADPVGAVTLNRRKDSLSASEVSADGDWIAPQATSKGELYVKHVDAIPVTDNGSTLSVDDGAGSLTVDGTVGITSPTTILNGKKTVTTAGTRVTLAASTSCKSVTIKALAANTGLIYVGDTSVASTNGFQLDAGESVSLDIANLTTVNLDSSVSGEGVSYVAVN